MIIRKAQDEDVREVSEITVEDWKIAYRGIIDSSFLDSLTVENQFQRDIRRYNEYMVAADQKGVLGYAWNRLIDSEDADCEIVALYVILF